MLLLLNFEHICIDKNSAFDKLDLVLLRSFVKIQQSNKRIIKDKETISQSKSKNRYTKDFGISILALNQMICLKHLSKGKSRSVIRV